MKVAILIIGATLGLSGAVFAQSLVEVAKKAEEQRTAAAAAAAAKAADDKKAAPKKAAAKADEESPTKVYTNKDLKASSPPSIEEPSALAILQNGAAQVLPPPIEQEPENILGMRDGARTYFARSLYEMRGRIRIWASHADALATTCSKASYEGLTRSMFQGHLSFCRSQIYELRLQKASVERFKAGMEEAGRKKGIYPGVMRELFVEIGWTP